VTYAIGGHPIDDLAAFALDAIDGDERRAVEHHLASCAWCRDEVVRHEATLSRLIDDEPPPPEVWQGVERAIRAMRDVESEPRHLTDVSQPRPPGRQRRWLAGALAAAAALVLAAGVAPRLVTELRDDDRGGSEVALGDRTLGRLVAPDGTEVARVVNGRTGDADRAFIVFEDADPLEPQRTYQLWALGGEVPVSLGLLGDGVGGPVPVTLPGGSVQLAISNEAEGGAVAPTGQIVAAGTVTPV
jgi:anti-sigma-K factor RskA